MLRLFLADEQPLFLRGLAALLAAQEDLQVVGQALDGHAAVDGIVDTAPDVAIVDVRLPLHDAPAVIAAVQTYAAGAPELAFQDGTDGANIVVTVRRYDDAHPPELPGYVFPPGAGGFAAVYDASGAALSRRCSYLIEGSTPPARLWTLYAADRSLRMIPPNGRRKSALQSLAILRNVDNSFSIVISPEAAPGYWLSVSGEGPMLFVLTLYDTPVAGSIGVEDVQLPQVLRTGCRG